MKVSPGQHAFRDLLYPYFQGNDASRHKSRIDGVVYSWYHDNDDRGLAGKSIILGTGVMAWNG